MLIQFMIDIRKLQTLYIVPLKTFTKILSQWNMAKKTESVINNSELDSVSDELDDLLK